MFTPWQRWVLLALFALLVAFRLPQAWTHGRFQDEEATVFLAYAWHRPWLDALFRPFAGYWNLGATATTLIIVELAKGGIVPLERAPYLTMAVAFTVQLLPAGLILTGRAIWLSGRLAVIAALLIIATAPSTEEVFFNVLHIQFHLALCAALILALDVPRSRAGAIAYSLLLFLAPLCGPGAIVLLPLFVVRTFQDRRSHRLIQLVALSAGAAVQLLLFYGSSPMRGHMFDPGTIAATMFVRLIALPARSFDRANGMGQAIYKSQAAGGSGWWWSVGATVMSFGALLIIAARRRDGAIWLVVSALCIAAVSFGFGMVILDKAELFNVAAGERYDFIPMILIGLGLIALAMRSQSGGRGVYILLCLVMIITGARSYNKPMQQFAQGPSWPVEVAAWRRDHNHPLAVWGAPFTADLSDQRRACSPITGNVSRSDDPRYCESGWVAAFYRSRSDQRRDRSNGPHSLSSTPSD